jgi:uncharacterized protein
MTEPSETDLDVEVTDNASERRYEARMAGTLVGFVTYRSTPGRLAFIHTEVDPEVRRRGIGGALARGALDDARARDVTVRAVCPFIAHFIDAHPEYGDLVA